MKKGGAFKTVIIHTKQIRYLKQVETVDFPFLLLFRVNYYEIHTGKELKQNKPKIH